MSTEETLSLTLALTLIRSHTLTVSAISEAMGLPTDENLKYIHEVASKALGLDPAPMTLPRRCSSNGLFQTQHGNPQ